LLPDFVTTLKTPPVERSYSAWYPPVITCTSCTKFMVRLVPEVPKRGSVAERPSMM
jgi:hypothetical protein